MAGSDGEWYDRDDPPGFSGQVDPPEDEDEEIEDVILTFKGPGNVEHDDDVAPNSDGSWGVTQASVQNFQVPGSDKMTIFTSGSNLGEINSYYDEWDFEVDRGTQFELVLQGLGPRNESGANGTTSGTAITDYRHYKRKRKKDTLKGDVRLDFSFPLYGYDADTHATNDDVGSAEIERVPTGYDKVIRRFTGSLWRYEFGRRRDRYAQLREFADGISNGPYQEMTDEGVRSPPGIEPFSGVEWVDGSWEPKEAHPDDPTGRTLSDEFPIQK